MHPGSIVRVGDTVRRPPGAPVVIDLLLHLEAVGFDGAPRFLGHDERGREVLSFIDGQVHHAPDWQHDDRANATRLGEFASWLRELHDATATFRPRPGHTPTRPLPVAGDHWTHGDVGYGNAVYRGGRLVALVDWEFAAPADPLHDLAALLGTAVRAPRPDADDHERRVRAVGLALDALSSGHCLTDAERRRLPELAAVVLDDAADFAVEHGFDDRGELMRWRADWFRSIDTGA